MIRRPWPDDPRPHRVLVYAVVDETGADLFGGDIRAIGVIERGTGGACRAAMNYCRAQCPNEGALWCGVLEMGEVELYHPRDIPDMEKWARIWSAHWGLPPGRPAA